MSLVGFTKLEALFRKAASIDIKKGHAKDITDIVKEKLIELLIAAERNTNMNDRDVIWESDLPITKGLQETLILFKEMNKELDMQDVLNSLTLIPSLKYPLSTELDEKLFVITGALLVVMAKIMKEIAGNDRALDHEIIEKTKKIMDLTL